ncbi:YtxH domain-containing protein [Bacillus sp. Bva_UNVM-123]|uniref:YtxH domain-containing protein n=1 Tax=Bacillus sp. Bva_UNVM-123 TaxID=2829798 RepID=UPI00391F5949
MRTKSLLLGFLIGGAAASISTLLAAPVSGKEARQYVKKNTDLIKNQLMDLKEQLTSLTSLAITATKEGKETISAFSSDIKTSINSWKQEIIPNQQAIQKELQEIETAIQELEAKLNKDNA